MTLRPEVFKLGNHEHRFLVAEPPGVPSLVVLSLHGSGSVPQRQARVSGMERLCSSGAVVAFPQGPWPSRSGFAWDLERDVEYLRALVSRLLARYPQTDRRVCIAGMSGGARMASRFASLHPELVCVLGAVAGLRAPARPRLEHPVRVVAFHGTADHLNPFAGGSTERWKESVPDAAAAWARALGLPGEPASQALTAHLTRTNFGDPGEEAAVTLFASRGAGHTWPGARLPLLPPFPVFPLSPLSPLFLRLTLGRTSKEVDATSEIWRATGRA